MIGAKTITKRSLFFFFFFSLVISTCYGSFVIQCILLLLSYNFLQVIENYCNNLQRGYTMQIFFFHYHLSYNYSTMQKKDDCKTTNRWDYLFTILHLAISKALNFPLWFESRAPWTIFNFSPPSLFESLWRMTNGRSSFPPPRSETRRSFISTVILRRLIDTDDPAQDTRLVGILRTPGIDSRV